MKDAIKAKLKEAMLVLSNSDSSIGEHGPSMEHLEQAWSEGHPYGDDALYVTCQHTWLLLKELYDMMEDRPTTERDTAETGRG